MQPADLKSVANAQTTEKPNHFAYLKNFRVEQCPLFVQHKCSYHRPYTCFNWHYESHRRRRPMKKRDGTFNYSPDFYCTKYDEQKGKCPDGDECTSLHRVAGDVERRYHLRYYKTCVCVHDTDSRGHCVKNGPHCAFAHGPSDLRKPVFDIREMQANEKGEFLENGNGTLCGPNNLDKERNMMTDDPKWLDVSYVLSNYKTEICKKHPRQCRQGYACPYYHNNRVWDRRRCPTKFKYRSTPCPNVKSGDEWGDPSQCDAGDSCQYCHTRSEQQFHPEIYKSSRCYDIHTQAYCPRGVFCAFAHADKEVTLARDLKARGGNAPAANEGGTSLGELLSSALGSQKEEGDGTNAAENVSNPSLQKSQHLEASMDSNNDASTNGYLSSSLPNREPISGGLPSKKPGVPQAAPPGLVPRSNSIGHRATPVSSPAIRPSGGSSGIISLPTNFSESMVLPAKPFGDMDSNARHNGGVSSPDILAFPEVAMSSSYSKAPGSERGEREANRRRQLSAKEGSLFGGLESGGLEGMSYSGFLGRGSFSGSPFSQCTAFNPLDGITGQIDDMTVDDPFFGVSTHPLDLEADSIRPQGLSFPRGSAPMSIPTSASGLPYGLWSSESPVMGSGNHFGVSIGSPSVPPGFPRQSSINQVTTGKSNVQEQSPNSMRFGSLPTSMSGQYPPPSNTPLTQEQEIAKLREELHGNRTKMASWEGRIAQAREACNAWQKEVETTKETLKRERQAKEEALVKLYLQQKDMEQLAQNLGNQNESASLLNMLSAQDRLTVPELRVVQNLMIRELERISKRIQDAESGAN